MGQFTLEITTPYRQFFTGEVDALVIPIEDGLYGVEPGHDPVVTLVEPGTLKYQMGGKWHTAAVSHGVAEIMPDYVILLLSAAERPEEIDLKRAEEAKRRAEEVLRQKGSMQEYHRNKLALARAVARIKTRNQ